MALFQLIHFPQFQRHKVFFRPSQLEMKPAVTTINENLKDSLPIAVILCPISNLIVSLLSLEDWAVFMNCPVFLVSYWYIQCHRIYKTAILILFTSKLMHQSVWNNIKRNPFTYTESEISMQILTVTFSDWIPQKILYRISWKWILFQKKTIIKNI